MVCAVPVSNKKDSESKKQKVKSTSGNREIIEMETIDNDLLLSKIAGGSCVERPPLFSPTGEVLYVIDEHIVHKFSTTTGLLIKDFESKTKHKLIGLQYSKTKPKVIFGCNQNGDIIQWKCKNGDIESTTKLPIENSIISTFNLIEMTSNVCALLTFKTAESNNAQFAIFDISTGKKINCPINIQLKKKPINVATESNYYHYFVLAQEYNLHIIYYKTWEYYSFKNVDLNSFVCVITHPTEEMVATGDKSGKILLWRELKLSKHTTLYHWHHTPITSLSFTETGTGLYSGGQESVLVKWILENPDLREYLPRMTAPIVHIAVAKGNAKTAISTADNSIQILGAQNKINCVIQNFTFVAENKTRLPPYPIGLQLNPRTNCLVMNGRLGHLQFYSTYTKSLLYNMEIVSENPLSLEIGRILYNTRVTKAAFNIDWMATGEVWDDQEHIAELRLKFWKFQSEKQTYALQTTIEMPHQNGFREIQFSSQLETGNLLCATVGNDNVIKMWALQSSDNLFDERKYWVCIAQTKYKNLDLHSVHFSEDGSLICAGYGNYLCVYRSHSLKIRAVLSSPSGYDGSIQAVKVCLNDHNMNNEKKQDTKTIIKQFNKFLEEGTINELIERVKDAKPKQNRKTNMKSKNITVSKQKDLFKKIQSLAELNLYQKFLLYRKLKIFCTISYEQKPQLLSYLQSTFGSFTKREKDLSRYVHSISNRDRFKAKHRMNQQLLRKEMTNNIVNYDIISIFKFLNLYDKQTKLNGELNVCNGQKTDLYEDHRKTNHPMVQSTAQIKIVQFASGELSHLIIVATENRILIWNLLTLKLQSVMKISAKILITDPLTSLCAIFTTQKQCKKIDIVEPKNNSYTISVYIIKPSTSMIIYHRINLPNILAACWVPRQNPKINSLDICWQSISTLYFLTDKQELMYLSSTKDDEATMSQAVHLNDPQKIARYSTFGSFVMNQSREKTIKSNETTLTSIGTFGKSTIKSVIEMSTHTMAPVNILCNNFIKSLIKSEKLTNVIDNNQETNQIDNQVKNDDSDDDDDDDDMLKLRRIVEKSKEMKIPKTNALENSQLQQNYEKVYNEQFHNMNF